MEHRFTNRLIHETSPYLLQHAHNPVNWFPWGEEALQKAVDEDKVILVSIGYAACHWCHVMEKESFENEAVAKLMNEHFINIKIDREERPDLDHIYMDAVQAMTGSGGWPLNVFLTPEKKPFYGGTYFPPVKAYGRASWTEILLGIQQAWMERRQEIITQSDTLTGHLQSSSALTQLNGIAPAEEEFTRAQCDVIFQNIMKQADRLWGGFGKAPKFPQTFTIQYLLQYHYFTGNREASEQAILSVDRMLEGGIYDHVGGGLARYSTDTEWLAPHFEKMLYDNAQLVNVLCDLYQLTSDRSYEKAIRKTLAFVEREMFDPLAGFYAAIDADSEGEEGKFYVWHKDEIDEVLGSDAAVFCEYFDVSSTGNWEGKNILRVLKKPGQFAREKDLQPELFENLVDQCLSKLLQVRNRRVRPQLDDKILLGWNALMITALCKASAALADKRYGMLAKNTFNIILSNFQAAQNTAAFYHTFKNGIAKYPAFLDDYAYLIQACIQLQEISSDTKYLDQARLMMEHVTADFGDEETGWFFFSGKGQSDLIVRKKEIYDGATASGNSIMAGNMFYLALVFDNARWHNIARRLTAWISAATVRHPSSFAIWASLILNQAYGINEVVITGKDHAAIRDELLHKYLPSRVLQCAGVPLDFPLLAGKDFGDETLIYLCKNYHCKLPVKTLEELFIQVADSTANEN